MQAKVLEAQIAVEVGTPGCRDAPKLLGREGLHRTRRLLQHADLHNQRSHNTKSVEIDEFPVARNRSKPNCTSPYSVALALRRPTRILPPLTSCYVVQPMYIERASILHIIFNKVNLPIFP
jgi:hypothetical protein